MLNTITKSTLVCLTAACFATFSAPEADAQIVIKKGNFGLRIGGPSYQPVVAPTYPVRPRVVTPIYTPIYRPISRPTYFTQLDRLASLMERTARSMAREAGYLARRSGNGEIQHLYEDSLEIARLADHIHEVLHREGASCHLAEDIEEIHELLHHTEEVLANVQVNNGRVYCSVRRCYWNGVSPSMLNYINRKLQTMVEISHRMEELVGH